MTIADFRSEFLYALGDPAGLRFTGIANQLFYDALNSAHIWLVPKLPINLMPLLQTNVATTDSVVAHIMPVNYGFGHSLYVDSVPATYYPRKKLIIMKNHYYLSTPTDPAYTIRYGNYEVLHAFVNKSVVLEYIKNPAKITVASTFFETPDVSHQVLLDYCLYWIKHYDREWEDAKINLSKATQGMMDLRGGKKLETFDEGE